MPNLQSNLGWALLCRHTDRQLGSGAHPLRSGARTPHRRGAAASRARRRGASVAGRTNTTTTRVEGLQAGPLALTGGGRRPAGLGRWGSVPRARSEQKKTKGCLARSTNPVPFARLLLPLQSAPTEWSSRQTHPAADWPASSWCEWLWPVSASQPTPRVQGKRRESQRPVEVGGNRAGRAALGPPPLRPPPCLRFILVVAAAASPRHLRGESRAPLTAASMEFVKCLGHPEEFYNLLRFKMGGRQKVIPKMDQVGRASLHPSGGGGGCAQ